MSFFLRLLLAAVAGAICLHAAASPTMAVTNGRWFDGQRFVPGTWYVVDGKLTRKAPARVDLRLDARGRHVVPPYADAHNHNMQGPWMAAQQLSSSLKQGVFYVAQLCANPTDIAGYRSMLSQPTTPDVLFATACISATDGHPIGLFLHFAKQGGDASATPEMARKMIVAVDTEAELAARWDEVLAGQPDLVKVILVDSARHAQRKGQPQYFGRNGLDPALLPTIVQRARAAGVRVVAHPDTAADARAAVQAGVDLLAHLPGYHFEKGLTAQDYRLDDETIALMAQRKIPLIATASVPQTMLRLKGAELAAVQAMQRDNLQRVLKAGVPLLIGSDNPFGGPLDEVEYLDGLGLLPRAQLLAALTMHTPQAMYPKRAVGRFDEGAEASFLLLDGDPLQDLKALRRVSLAVKQGNVLSLR